MRWWINLVLAALLLGGCFSSPPLSTCKENKDCPDNLPVCQDGFCFHTSVNYTVPLCAGEGVTGECCDLHTGDGCQVTSQQLGVVTATMTSEWVAALTEDGTVRWFDEALDPAGESVLFGARGALAARGGEQPEVCALDERGLLCAAGPDSGFVSELKVVGAIGRGVVCSDGFSLVATGDAIYVPAENHSNVLPVPIGELPDGLGPVVHRPSGAVAVPTGAGTAVKLLLPHSQIYDLTTLRDFDVHQSELPGGVLGMALSEEKLYVASRHGRLVAVQLDAVPESTDGNWTSQSMEAPQWVAGPVVGATGDVLVMDSEGSLLLINQGNKAAPTRWAGVVPLSGLNAVPGGGVGGLGASSSLVVMAPASFYPWLVGDGPILSIQQEITGCSQPLDLLLGRSNGSALAICREGLHLVVPPAPTDSHSPWPTVHGPGGSGCYEG